jgi:TonB dependent receptor
MGAYVQDTWHVSQRLTLNLGLRYGFEGGFYEAHDRLSNFSPNAINPATDTPGALVFASSDNRLLQPNHDLLFGPRFGFAYALRAGFVVRSAYGIFFIPNGAQQNFNTALPGFGINQNLQTSDQKTPVFQLSAGPPPYVIPTGANRTGAISNGSSIGYWPLEAGQPYVQQWQFSIQKQLGTQTVVEAAYVGNKGTRLLFPRDLNQVPPNLLGPGDTQLLRPFRQFLQISTRNNDANSAYHALQIKANRRFAGGLTFLANYTFSKSMDNSSYDTTTGIGTQYQIASNPGLNRGPSQFDQTHRAVLAYVYDLPVGHGRKWLDRGGLADAILGGWRTSGSFIANSGIPFNVYVGGPGIANTGALSGYLFPDRIKDGNSPSDQRSAQRWFDTSAFVDPPKYRFGTAGRDILRGPGAWNFDAALMKDFTLPIHWERTQLEFRADAFNVFNHANPGLPSNTTDSSAFGTITSASQPRKLQVGVQLMF